ncbi:MAG: photosynthetic reaction center cytochrome PufC [Pseudomonadota bacterium]
MTLQKRNAWVLTSAAVVAATLAGCERPPIETTQNGNAGTGMYQVSNPRAVTPELEIPASMPPAPAAGPTAGEIYQNVQVLGDLSVAEFTRTMASITAWVSPEEGCNYCHNPQNLASDDVYTKVVSRRMMEMTKSINANWSNHVKDVGVTCYTCHNGKPVPEHIWFATEEPNSQPFLGNRFGQNIASTEVGLQSLPEPFMKLLTVQDGPAIHIAGDGWEPGVSESNIKYSEYTMALMTHMSGALGVNCTYCHNTNNFASYEESANGVIRMQAKHGIEMVQYLNEDYLDPLGPVYPDYRLGPTGDAPKAYCTTCHGGLNKPLNGAVMAPEFPAFWSR